MLQNNAEFILGSDEACLMASPTGQVKVFGDKLKDKHEKIVNDSRVSITIVRTAATGGATGPTLFDRGSQGEGGLHSQLAPAPRSRRSCR